MDSVIQLLNNRAQVIIEIPKQRNVTILSQFAIVYKSSHHAVASMCHAMPFWTRALKKKHFLWCSYRVKTNRNVVSWSMGTLHYSFPKQCFLIASACWASLQKFLKGTLTRTSSKFKAETHDATNRCDTSPRQVAATYRVVWHVKIIVAATEFRHCNLSHKFKLVWIHATYRSDKLSASDLSQQQCRRGDLSPRFVASCVSAFIKSPWQKASAKV